MNRPSRHTDTADATDAAPPVLSSLLHARPAQAPVTVTLLAINILVFLAMLLNGGSLWHGSTAVPLEWGANFGPATQDGQWWRLGSALFLHFGVIHLALNMWALWDVGRLIEQLFGRWRFIALYLGSGVIGNLLSLAIQGNQAVSGGASGAIFSLYGALLVFLLRERRQVDPGEFRWLFGAASAFIVLALVMGSLVPGIDNAAHLGGLVAGALWGLVLARRWTHRSPHPRATRAIAAAVLVAATTALVVNIPAPSYRLGEELRARQAISQFLQQDQRISQQWETILGQGQKDKLSFDQLAGRIDDTVTTPYQQSFEQLSGLHLDAAAPSAPALEALRAYAARRTDASQAMAEGLRDRDAEKFRKALESARQAPEWVRGTVGAASDDGTGAAVPPGATPGQ
ncbi:rhomboid family intramembrane serine protease [Comamonadaceae bacterium G21597-S1]|nr:rhomboid family intramembrane serine protease [Comamonadaceae bacterium G21597-S1]